MENSEIAVRCIDINKSFGKGELETNVLKSVSFEVQNSEFLMLVGPSGCGKTTLISIIAGLLQPNSGNCIVGGHNYQEMSNKEMLAFRAKNIGFVFQAFHLIPSLTIAENVAIPMIIGGMSRKDATKAASEVLEMVELGDKVSALPMLLSGGQQQRVAIARALIHKPDLLICDEPTSALDFDTGRRIVELMNNINKDQKTTFLIVTHDERILKYATRIVHLNDGKIEKETTN